jgi:arylformamidase
MNAGDAAWYDRMYNNRALVPDHAMYFARWKEESAWARSRLPCELDIAYGEEPGETLDVFPAEQGDGPVLVFLHGGYWRSLDKSDHSFVAPAFTRHNTCVVVPNYALCPAVTIPQIVLQVTRAVAWTWHNARRFGGDPRRIVVAGHSAGGHLAAMLLTCLWPRFDPALPAGTVRSALSISGLHDLDPIMRTPFLQDSLQLTREQVAQASPTRLPPPASGTLYSVAGGDESAEFHRQCRLIQEAWGSQRVPVCEIVPGLNHFNVLDALVEPRHRLQQLALDLLRG